MLEALCASAAGEPPLPVVLALFKRDVCEALALAASGIVLDPALGAPAAIAGGVLPRDVALVLSASAEAVENEEWARVGEIRSGWTPDDARRLGASAAALTAYYNPNHGEAASRQRALVRAFVEACRAADLLCLIQVFTYALRSADPTTFARIRPELIVDAASEFGALGADLLALEFPRVAVPDGVYERERDALELDACRAVDAASDVPWLVASAPVSPPAFLRQVRLACAAGASGFVAGRVLWEPACVPMSRSRRRWWLAARAVPRLRALTCTAHETATPWWSRWGPHPTMLCDTTAAG